MSKEELSKLEDQLKNIIVDTFDPTSTRWRRNHTARAEWFFLWNEQRKLDDQTHAFLISTLPVPNSYYHEIYKKFYKTAGFEQEYECKFLTKDEPPFEK